MEKRAILRRMEKRVAKLERRAAKLERENKALRAGQAALLEAMGQMSSTFAQGGVAQAAVEIGGAIKLFNVNDGAILRTFKHHTREVMCLALLPDGLRFVSGSRDKTARIVEIGPLPQ